MKNASTFTTHLLLSQDAPFPFRDFICCVTKGFILGVCHSSFLSIIYNLPKHTALHYQKPKGSGRNVTCVNTIT